MRSLFFPLVSTLLLVLISAVVVSAQTATPTPPSLQSADDYQQAALVQLGNLRSAAGDMYQINAISDAALVFYEELLQGEVTTFASTVDPPAEFAPFHTRLFMALRPCITANRILQTMNADIFSFSIASSYAQACYMAASDASVEWSRVTGTSPVFPSVVPADLILTPTPIPTATFEITPTDSITTPVSVEMGTDVDDLGLPWRLSEDSDPYIVLENWTTYRNQRGEFAVAGRLRNADASRRFSLATIVVKFYDANDRIIHVAEGSASGHWVDPGELTTFNFNTYWEPEGVASYIVEIFGSDWQE